jgi:hypothetical protein
MTLALKPATSTRPRRLLAQPWSDRTDAIPRTLTQAFGPYARDSLVITAEQDKAERRRDGHHLIVPVCLACLVVLALVLLSDAASIAAAVSA